jgi:hypothetical protein
MQPDGGRAFVMVAAVYWMRVITGRTTYSVAAFWPKAK